jgi:hypothetical protein
MSVTAFFVILLLSPFLSFGSFHPIHVSVTEIEYDGTEKELEIIIRIFLDDFERAIRTQRNQPELDILNPGKGLTTEQLMSEYLKEHFIVNIHGQVQPFRYLGQEDEGLAVICYISVSNVSEWTGLTVTNNALQEIYDDQSNLVHVMSGGNVKSARLVKDNASRTFTFDE